MFEGKTLEGCGGGGAGDNSTLVDVAAKIRMHTL